MQLHRKGSPLLTRVGSGCDNPPSNTGCANVCCSTLLHMHAKLHMDTHHGKECHPVACKSFPLRKLTLIQQGSDPTMAWFDDNINIPHTDNHSGHMWQGWAPLATGNQPTSGCLSAYRSDIIISGPPWPNITLYASTEAALQDIATQPIHGFSTRDFWPCLGSPCDRSPYRFRLAQCIRTAFGRIWPNLVRNPDFGSHGSHHRPPTFSSRFSPTCSSWDWNPVDWHAHAGRSVDSEAARMHVASHSITLDAGQLNNTFGRNLDMFHVFAGTTMTMHDDHDIAGIVPAIAPDRSFPMAQDDTEMAPSMQCDRHDSWSRALARLHPVTWHACWHSDRLAKTESQHTTTHHNRHNTISDMVLMSISIFDGYTIYLLLLPLITSKSINNHHAHVIVMLSMISKVGAGPRSRGGGDAGSSSGGSRIIPNAMDLVTQENWDFLPGMKRWDGIPFHDFTRIWLAALVVALGSIVQAGFTLLQTAEGEDDGRADVDPEEKKQNHMNRKARLYACIMNYISPTSRIYRIARTEFPNNGPGLYKWLKVVGQLDRNEDEQEELRNQWEEATMAKVGIKFNYNAVFEWLNWVDEMGSQELLRKSPVQRRKKFLKGFPESFDNVITPELMQGDIGSYRIPATYPAHHPKAGQAHDDAGKPDLEALARALTPLWVAKIRSGAIKAAPRGSVYQVNDDDEADDGTHDDESDDDENAYEFKKFDKRGKKPFIRKRREKDKPSSSRKSDKYRSRQESADAVSRSKVNARMVCLVCGGLGHASNVDGMACLTSQLNIKVPKSDLQKIKYPNGITYPSFDRKSKGKSVNQVEQSNSESDQSSSDDGGTNVADYASVYHTIDTRDVNYQSYSSSSSSEPSPRKSKSKSATTKAKAN